MAQAQSTQPPNTPANALESVLTLPIAKRRKIYPHDVEDIAKCAANRLTDTEACNLLGIYPMTWFNWRAKPKNQAKFSDILSRLRAERITACMEGIERAGQKDWRALDRLLERTDPERFVDKREASVAVAVQIDNGALLGAIKRVYGGGDAPVEVPASKPVKRLKAAPAVETPSTTEGGA